MGPLTESDPFVSSAPDSTEFPERAVGTDLLKRGLIVAPLIIGVAGVWRGADGAVSAALAIAVVLLNFTIAAFSIGWAARKSSAHLAGTVLGGYIVRLGIVTAAFLVLRDREWFDIWAFGITLLVTHVGLLVWESRYVNLSLAAPGLRPGPLPPTGEE